MTARTRIGGLIATGMIFLAGQVTEVLGGRSGDRLPAAGGILDFNRPGRST